MTKSSTLGIKGWRLPDGSTLPPPEAYTSKMDWLTSPQVGILLPKAREVLESLGEKYDHNQMNRYYQAALSYLYGKAIETLDIRYERVGGTVCSSET